MQAAVTEGGRCLKRVGGASSLCLVMPRQLCLGKGENRKACGREQQQHLPEAAATAQAGHPGQLDATQKSHKSNQQSLKATEHTNTNMNHGTHE